MRDVMRGCYCRKRQGVGGFRCNLYDRSLGDPRTLFPSFSTWVRIAEIGAVMGFTLQQVVRVIRRIVFAALIIALLAPVVPAASVHAAGNTQYVSAYLDSPGTLTDCRTVAANCNLRNALNAAADGDTIQFVQGTFGWPITYTLDSARGTLTVSHAVTIQGPGSDTLTVSGGKAVTVFTVNRGVTATISGLTITDGNNINPGGGIFNLGTLTVAQSVIQNNSSPNGFGGGIDSVGTLMLTGCTIGGNSSAFGGGVSSGTFGFNATSLTITNSTITGNTATGGAGGGILTYGVGTDTITASTIQGNHATSGGGIANGDNVSGRGSAGSDVTISGSTVRDNQATGTGGGIYNNASLTFNSSLTLTNATISGNQAGGNGGGLFNESFGGFPTNAALIATTVSNNTVGNGGSSGGGINDASGATVTLTASLVAGNIATGGATAPDLANAITSGGHNLIGVGTGSTGIVDGSNGDHIGTASAPINPKLSPLAANGGPTATHALLPNSPAIEMGGVCPNGVTQDQRGQPRIGACDIGAYEYQPVTPTVSNATAPASGGSVTFHGTGFQTGTQLTIGNTTLTAPASGVSDDGTALTLTVPAHSVGTVSVVIANPGTGHVAVGTLTYQPVVTSLSATSGAATGGSHVTITGAGFAGGASVLFSNNVAISGAQVAIQGGVSAAGGIVSLQNTIVAGNTRSDSIAADVTGAVTSLGRNLIGNTSGSSGFGMSDLTNVNPLLDSLQNNGGPTQTQALLPTSPALDAVPATGAGCPDTDQRSVSRPQGGSCDIGAYELATTTYVDVRAPASGYGTQAAPFPTISAGVHNVIAGGAVHVAANTNALPTYNDHVTIDRNVTITGAGTSTTIVDGTNSGTVFTVNNGMSANLSGVTIQHGANSSSGGGGIANHGALTLADSVVANNSAGDGGGILTDGNALTLTASTVSVNTATSSGGGIFVGGGTVQITGSTISGNTLSARGAGIFNGGTLTLTDSTVSGNTARSGEIGGGIDNDAGGVLSLVNGTITRNSPDGLYSHSRGSAAIRDTIIAGNMGLDINGAVTSNGNNLIGDMSGSSGVTNGTKGDIVGTAASPVDPRLVPLALNAPGTTQTHALGPASPAIDAGGACPSRVSADQRGVMRPQGNACDIGAYEYVAVTPTLHPAQTGTAGQRLSFTGTGFQTGTAVTVNGALLPITVAADGQSFTATVPAHAAGTVPVVVTNPGTGHTATSSLMYAAPNVAPSPPRPSGSPLTGNPIPMPSPRANLAPTGPTPNPLPPSR